jgi:hypothetical protein
MKLFDFKFLILLGLALVIYFIYKELEYHRERLTYCEEKIKEIVDNNLNVIKKLSLDATDSIKQISISSIKDTQYNEELNHNEELNYDEDLQIDKDNQFEIVKQFDKDIPTFIENKNLSISLPVKTLMEQSVKSNIDTSSDESTSSQSENIMIKINNSEKDSEFKKESESKHLEIYSNDNDNNIETSISDSLIISKTNSETAKSSKTNSETAKSLKTNSETAKSSKTNSETAKSLKTNSETSKSSKTNGETSNTLKIKTLKIKSSKSTVNKNTKEDLDASNFLIKNILNSLEKKTDTNKLSDINSSQELENVIDALKNEIENTESEQKTATSKNGSNVLSKMKLHELQNLARKENLSIDKKVNGHQKKKTKQELIDELSKI